MNNLFTSLQVYQRTCPAKECVIEEYDNFKNEKSIYTYCLWYNYSFRPRAGFSVMFRSNPSEETIFLVSSFDNVSNCKANPKIYNDGYIIINLNNIENIMLKKHFDINEGRYVHSLFPLDKDNLKKCCQATSLNLRVMTNDSKLGADYNDFPELILEFRTIWNKAIDSNMYSNSVREFQKIIKFI